ncbi:MAG: DUF4111 domain-containing protein [Oscillospiraceae bacterium]|nr:DUF4111 domain-containing protein [Oscillospiraceae bacterium]
MDYNLILQQIKESYIEVLQDNLVGIYVHGSIAFNCFRWENSDIDYIVVVNRSLSNDVKNELMKETLRIRKSGPPNGFEMSVVLKKYCLNFEYPTPYDLHFSDMHKERYENNPLEYCEKMNGVDIDLAAHFTVIKEASIVLYGEPIVSVFGVIPKEYHLDSIKNDIQVAKDGVKDNPVYYILNLCRTLAYKNDNLILSKAQGGNWALENLDYKYNSVIRAALDYYVSDKSITIDIDTNLALDFCEYMINQIFEKV